MAMKRREDGMTSKTLILPQMVGQSSLLFVGGSRTPRKLGLHREAAKPLGYQPMQNQELQIQALQSLLREPILFRPATQLTFEDEERMTPTRLSKIVREDENKPDNQDQINNSEIVSRFLVADIRRYLVLPTDKVHIW